MKQLKYHLIDGEVISIPVLIKDAIFQGVISQDFSIRIISNRSESVINLQGKSLIDCKKLVKKEMRRLGANFLDEIRTKKEKI